MLHCRVLLLTVCNELAKTTISKTECLGNSVFDWLRTGRSCIDWYQSPTDIYSKIKVRIYALPLPRWLLAFSQRQSPNEFQPRLFLTPRTDDLMVLSSLDPSNSQPSRIDLLIVNYALQILWALNIRLEEHFPTRDLETGKEGCARTPYRVDKKCCIKADGWIRLTLRAGLRRPTFFRRSSIR